ncbi:MAG: NYN domain-containing protein [Candidatus Binatia bacterium]
MAGRAAVFIDGGYLDKVLQEDFASPHIAYDKLVVALTQTKDLFRTYYYHCPPYQSNPPTSEESKRYGRKHAFFTRLSLLPSFEVRLGRLVKQGYDEKGRPIFIQKRVDCMIAVDMVLLAAKRQVTHIELISGDSDFVPAVEAVKRESVVVTLWHGNFQGKTSPSRDLYKTCDDRQPITRDLISRILRT